MGNASRSFQIFCKPAGARCNLDCSYCYYLEKKHLYPNDGIFKMPDELLERYIAQHILTSPDDVIRFSWHGGEPTILGLDYFQNIVNFQKKYKDPGRKIINGIQTNGTLLTEEWCRFFKKEGFSIGLSLDGPQELHDIYRITRDGKPTHKRSLHGYNLLREQGIIPDILCVVNAHNVEYPVEVYNFFKQIDAKYIGFLPLVEPESWEEKGVSKNTVPSEGFGRFLCKIFDEWRNRDIGEVKVQIFEEAAKTAFNQEHELCIFRRICGDVPVIEHNGDFFSCDHFVDSDHHVGNIGSTTLVELLESPMQLAFGRNKSATLPQYCRECEVLDMCNGGCPKNRFIPTPNGTDGLNYLCAGYRLLFNHMGGFIKELANLWNRQTPEFLGSQMNAGKKQTRTKIGRNDPCPCGSGKKYKRCCLGR